MNYQKENLVLDFDLAIPPHVLDDLCCRFIINVPYQEKKDLVRICFQIEQAHWFYLDFYNKFNEPRRPCTLKEFARNIFYHIQYLRPFLKDLDMIIDDWKEYKYSVPTFGAIILDKECKNILLVQSYWSKSSWGFPKGKINKDETPCHCAAREVYEETGFNISNLIHPDAYVETVINDQCIRLYIVSGVSQSTKFVPQTRNEIKDIKWFPLDVIPNKKTKVKNKLNSTFYMVIPFMRDLRKWLLQNSAPKVTKQRRSFKSFSEVEDLLQTTSVDGVASTSFHQQTYDLSHLVNNTEFSQHLPTCNINELYEGSDEDDIKQSNEEIYGIPKVKTTYVTGKNVDSYLLTCSDVSYMKKNRLNNNLEQRYAPPNNKESISSCNNKCENALKLEKNDKLVKTIEKKSSLVSSNNNFHQKHVNDISCDSGHSLNNTFVKDNIRKVALKYINCQEKNTYIHPQKIYNHSNESDNRETFLDDLKINEPNHLRNVPSKNDFLQRLSNNKAIQAMQSFKFNKEALLKSVE